MAKHLTHVDAIYYRMLFTEWAGALLAPARAPQGRSHHDGQSALYLSATPQGCKIASQRYFQAHDPPRAIYPLHVRSHNIIDLRDSDATTHYGIDTTHRATEWQDIVASGKPSPTWAISDRVRELGLDGMLYASRSQPRLTHLTLFRWNAPDGPTSVTADGPPIHT